MTSVTPIDDAGRNALAHQWLGSNVDGVDLYIECLDIADACGGPKFIRVRIDIPFLVMLQQRVDFCCAQNALDITEVRKPDYWVNAPKHVPVDSWFFYVDQSAFRFKGFLTGNLLTESITLSVEDLGRCLNSIQLKKTGVPTDDNGLLRFHWHGGSLLYAEYHPRKLLKEVLRACPEVAARQLAIEMAARISESGIVVSGNAPFTAPAESVGRRRMVL